MDLNLDGASIEYAVPMPVQVDEVIDRGDMVWWDDGNTTIKSASNFTWDSSGAQTRRQFKRLFAGIAMTYHRDGDAKGTMMVAVLATVEVKTISRAFVFGELLGPDDATSKLLDQTLERQQDPSECIAEAIMDHTDAVTTTKVIIRGNLVGIAARATNEKRTLTVFTMKPSANADILTDIPAHELFGGPVEILALQAITTVIIDTGDVTITMDKGSTSLADLVVATSSSAVGELTRVDLSSDANRFFAADDTLTLKSDGGTTTGELAFIIEYRPL